MQRVKAKRYSIKRKHTFISKKEDFDIKFFLDNHPE